MTYFSLASCEEMLIIEGASTNCVLSDGDMVISVFIDTSATGSDMIAVCDVVAFIL